MEREVGGGIGMGNTCKPLAVSFQCMTKSTTNKKKRKKKQSSCSRGECFSGLDRRSDQAQHSLKPKPNPEQSSNSLKSMKAEKGEEAAEEI